jgi:hypothetical protein
MENVERVGDAERATVMGATMGWTRKQGSGCVNKALRAGEWMGEEDGEWMREVG